MRGVGSDTFFATAGGRTEGKQGRPSEVLGLVVALKKKTNVVSPLLREFLNPNDPKAVEIEQQRRLSWPI